MLDIYLFITIFVLYLNQNKMNDEVKKAIEKVLKDEYLMPENRIMLNELIRKHETTSEAKTTVAKGN